MPPEGVAASLPRGALLRHAGGCFSPRVLDFLCFETPRSVLEKDEDDEQLLFYLVPSEGTLEQHVQQVSLTIRWPCVGGWWRLGFNFKRERWCWRVTGSASSTGGTQV